jgi:uncharacterized protein (TIGR02265 family)
VIVESLTPGRMLEGTFDEDEIAKSIPERNQVKGMFFGRFVEALAGDWRSVERRLFQPPRDGRYVLFSDYPQHDYFRLYCATSRKLFPALGISEAIRRLGRQDFQVFAATTLGRVLLSMVSDARGALHKLPLVYSKVIRANWTVHTRDMDARTVRVEMDPHYGRWEYQAGQFEGIVLAMGEEPTISIHELSVRGLRFDVVCEGQ